MYFCSFEVFNKMATTGYFPSHIKYIELDSNLGLPSVYQVDYFFITEILNSESKIYKNTKFGSFVVLIFLLFSPTDFHLATALNI